MEVTAIYDWEGNLSTYQWDNMSVPIAEGNRHYRMIKDAIADGTCIINEPLIEEVTAAYDRKGNLSGYRWNHIFIPVPIDESRQFYRMVKRAIEDGSCIIKEPDPIQADKPVLKVETLIFCIFFDRPWPHLKSSYQGEMSYQSNDEAESRTYAFRLINVSSTGELDRFDLLFDFHPGISKEQFPIEFPLQSGILELEVPVRYLQKLFRNEKSQLEEDMIGFIDSIVMPHLWESGRSEPETKYLISLGVFYLGNFIMEVGNRVIEAFTREYGGLPIGYIDKWKIYQETIVINKYEDGSHKLGAVSMQGKQSFGLSGKWPSWTSSLQQMSEPNNHPTHPYDYAVKRCRMLVKAGLHMEALCLVDALLEVNIRDVLCACMRSDPEVQQIILDRVNHKQQLEILKKIAKFADDEVIRSSDDYLAKIENARMIYKYRNAYLHELTLFEEGTQGSNSNKMQYLTVKQRRYLEELMQGFIDVNESRWWFSMQRRLADGKDSSAIQIIQESVNKTAKL